MDIGHFCSGLKKLNLTQTQEALAILWAYDEKTPDVIMSAGAISKIIYETGLGSPHSTKLGEQIKKSGKVIASAKGFRLKALSRSQIRDWIHPLLGAAKPSVDQDLGYLPQGVWQDTRGYIERVCAQLNGCFQFEFYDAASVMLRRLIETLIIECYEQLNRQQEIKDNDGNYYMLKVLVAKALDVSGLNLGRDAQKTLRDIKELGDRSAHSRRYNAIKADLEKVQSGVRVATDELISLAALRKQEASTK